MAEQSHMSIINSSSRFVLEKMGLSAEWYYLSQQQLTTKYFILLGCYQLGGNFISWKEEQFGRAAAVLSSGSVGASTGLCHGCRRELTEQRSPSIPTISALTLPVAGSRASLCVCRDRLLPSKAGRAQGGLSWLSTAVVLLPCSWRCSGTWEWITRGHRQWC